MNRKNSINQPNATSVTFHSFMHGQKRHLARITEPSNDDYHNYVSDNCDYNFGTFDDFGVKMTKKYHIT